MKLMLTSAAVLFSLNALAVPFQVKDVMCGNFGYYHKQPCLLIVANETETAGVLLDSKYVMSKVRDVREVIGKNVDVKIQDLLMLTFEEEENVRGFINYPEAKYYSATPKEFVFLGL